MADRAVTRLIARLGSNGRARWILAGVLIVLVLIVAAWIRLSGRETTDDAQIDGHIAPVAARIGGSVATVLVHDNQTVQAGDVLVKIDTRDLEVALAKVQADLDEARATAKAAHAGGAVNTTLASSQLAGAKAEQLTARTGVELADSDIDAATAKLSAAEARQREAEANLAKATKDRERLEPLVKKDEVSHQQFDLAVTSEAAARAAVDSANASVIEAQKAVDIARNRKSQAENRVTQASSSVEAAATVPNQVHVIRANAESADARVAQEEAAVAQAKLNLEYATIRAPIAGLVSRKTVEVGQIVQPGQPLMALVPLDKVWVTANFKETQLAAIRPGQEASISVDAYGGRTFKGSVDSIAAATGARFSLLPPENASGNFVKVVQRIPVKIAIDTSQDPQHVLRPGMSVEATVFTR